LLRWCGVRIDLPPNFTPLALASARPRAVRFKMRRRSSFTTTPPTMAAPEIEHVLVDARLVGGEKRVIMPVVSAAVGIVVF
jgi:hypothetical protein